VKKTCAQRETLAIAGFAMKGNQFDGLYVGRRKRKVLTSAKGQYGLTQSQPLLVCP
jgi:bifunctional non-homologous end joining protein LigD